MTDKTDAKKLSILNILSVSEKPLASAQICDELFSFGHRMTERTVRLYLQQMDEAGLIKTINRRGRQITEKGLIRLKSSKTLQHEGFLSATIDNMAYRMSYDLEARAGSVVVNVTLVKPSDLLKHLDMIYRVFAAGYALGNLVSLLTPGELLGRLNVPEGMVGFATICSTTINGVLVKNGINVISRFGALLELQDHKPSRFVDLIMYDGTTVDPISVFIRSGMTDYTGAVKTGNGFIGTSFRELPAASRDFVDHIGKEMEKAGLGGFMKIGRNGESLLDVPVSIGRVGAIIVEGLNPTSILEENGIRADSVAMTGFLEFSRLFHYTELENGLAEQIP